MASAVNDTAREFGSALGIAVLGIVLTQTYEAGVQDAIAGPPSEIAPTLVTATFGPRRAFHAPIESTMAPLS